MDDDDDDRRIEATAKLEGELTDAALVLSEDFDYSRDDIENLLEQVVFSNL